MHYMQILVIISILLFTSIESFKPILHKYKYTKNSLNMLDFDGSPTAYAAIFAVTMIPSLLIVKFVGDAADDSRGTLSEKTQQEFKRKMMQQPTLNLSIPTSEEEELKKLIAKAYIQDKDVDVAVLEEKLKQRQQWRKEVNALKKQQLLNPAPADDDEGW